MFTNKANNLACFMLSQNRGFGAAWLKSAIAKAHKKNPEKTLAILVHQSEIKDGSLDKTVLPEGLTASDDFRKDLNMSNSYWFYHKVGRSEGMKRILLLQKSTDKIDAKPEDIRKSYRALGVTACQQL